MKNKGMPFHADDTRFAAKVCCTYKAWVQSLALLKKMGGAGILICSEPTILQRLTLKTVERGMVVLVFNPSTREAKEGVQGQSANK